MALTSGFCALVQAFRDRAIRGSKTEGVVKATVTMED